MTSSEILVSAKGVSYKKLNTLGQGQFGKVFRIADPQNRIFALKEFDFGVKELSEKQKKAIAVEIQIMAKIIHPRILHLHDQIKMMNGLGVVTTFCDGGDLETLLLNTAANRGFGEEAALKIVREIGEAFYVLRRHRVIHRDLKLANIFLKEGQVVIGDFGFAKIGVSSVVSKLGTPYYMAPEILFQHQKYYDSRCDLWSIGVCFFILIYGVLPFDANSLTELTNKIEAYSGDRLRFPRHQQVSGTTKQVLIRLLQKIPEERLKFSDFFRFCGIALSDSEVSQLNSSQAVSEKSECDEQLRLSQIDNFRGNIFSQIQPSKTHESAPLAVPSRAPVAVQPPTPNGAQTPQSRIELLNSAESLKYFPTLQGDNTFGFFLLQSEADSAVALPYLNEINKLIFNTRAIQALAELRSVKPNSILDGEVNVSCQLLEIFATRKTELITQELKSVLLGQNNVFKLNDFPQVCASQVYSDLCKCMSLFERQVAQLYQFQHQRFQNDIPAFQGDFQLYKAMPIVQVENASRKLAYKLIEAYQEKHMVYPEPGKTLMMKMIIHWCYFSKILQIPPMNKTVRDWVSFYGSIHSLSREKMHLYLMDLRTK